MKTPRRDTPEHIAVAQARNARKILVLFLLAALVLPACGAEGASETPQELHGVAATTQEEAVPQPEEGSRISAGTGERFGMGAALDDEGAPPPQPASPRLPAAEEPAPEPETPEPEVAPASSPSVPPAEASAEPTPEAEASPPSDTRMYFTVPALGLEVVEVVSGTSKEAMEQGVIHVPGTSFPLLAAEETGSNTYLAAHRIGFPGTGSDRVFYDLPALSLGDEVILEDSNDGAYTYQVAEAAEVSPYDTRVANPIPGRDVVTLQTCTEDFGDLWGESLEWAARYVVRAARAS